MNFLRYRVRWALSLFVQHWQVYNEWDIFKLNDMLEVFGILSVDPALSLLAEDK